MSAATFDQIKNIIVADEKFLMNFSLYYIFALLVYKLNSLFYRPVDIVIWLSF